jgi:hypothetical protein
LNTLYAYNYVNGIPDTVSNQRDNRYDKDNICKVPIDGSHITDPSTLGAVYYPNRNAWYESNGLAYFKCDGFGILAGTIGHSFDGNQYCNYGGSVEYNSPVGQGYWTTNPKINGALQNHIESILSDKWFRLPADATYTANWKIKHHWADRVSPESPSDPVDIDPTWNDYPDVCDECWGFNESGIELFLSKLGKYDYFYQLGTAYQYIPDGLCLAATVVEGVRSGGSPPNPTASEALAAWGCISEGAGNWRTTFRRSCGRPSFMRSGDLAMPKDIWKPLVPGGETNIGDCPYASEEWFGSWTAEIPDIMDCDTEQESIVGYVGDYSFKIAGDYTSTLKIGYMVHIYMSDNSKLSVTASEMKSCYVHAIVFDGTHTVVSVTDTVGSFDTVSWNPEISERHDPVEVLWERGTYTLKYRQDPQLLLDLYDLLNLCIYKDVAASVPTMGINIVAHGAVEGADSAAMAGFLANIVHVNMNLSEDWLDYPDAILLNDPESQYYLDHPNETPPMYLANNWWTFSQIAGSSGLVGTYLDTVPQSCSFMYGAFYDASCFKVTFDESIKQKPDRVIIRLGIIPQRDWNLGYITNDTGLPIDDTFSQYTSLDEIGIANIIITKQGSGGDYTWPGEGITHYKSAAVSKLNKWYLFRPTSLWTSTTYEFLLWDNSKLNRTFGIASIPFSISGSISKVTIVLHFEDVPNSIYTSNFYHIDAPRVLIKDTMPPRPNPPTHAIDPEAYLKHELQVDHADSDVAAYSKEQEDSSEGYEVGTRVSYLCEFEEIFEYVGRTPDWIFGEDSDGVYEVGDFVYYESLLYINKTGNNTSTTPLHDLINWSYIPYAPPTNPDWLWIPDYFDIRIKGESCLCVDEENSNPVKYSFRCVEEESFNAPDGIPNWLVSREADIIVGTFECDYILLDHTKPTFVGKFYHKGSAGDFSVGDYVEILGHGCYTVTSSGETASSGNWVSGTAYTLGVVVTYDSKYYEVYVDTVVNTTQPPSEDIGEYHEVALGCYFKVPNFDSWTRKYGYVINYTKLYTEAMWESTDNIYNGSHFTWRAKDNASNVQGMPEDNVTSLSEAVVLLDIDKYPAEVIQDELP